MGWICKQCSSENSFRDKTCTNCHALMSDEEIKKIVAEEIATQKIIIKGKLTSVWLRFIDILDIIISKRKILNSAAVIIILSMLISYTVSLNNFNASSIAYNSLNQTSLKAGILVHNFDTSNKLKQQDMKISINEKLNKDSKKLNYIITAGGIKKLQASSNNKKNFMDNLIKVLSIRSKTKNQTK